MPPGREIGIGFRVRRDVTRHRQGARGLRRRIFDAAVLSLPVVAAKAPPSLATEGTSPIEDTGPPWVAITLLVLALVFVAVFGARVIRVIDRRTVSWFDAWLKTTVIVAYFTVFTVVLPSFVLQTSAVSSLSRTMQELVGSGVWAVGLGFGLWGLWYAQRTDRI
jgi:hypothetical protein